VVTLVASEYGRDATDLATQVATLAAVGFVPQGHKHAFTVGPHGAEMIQIYAPAGPEARFKDWAIHPPIRD
jgi:hypothetical protein